MIEFELVQPSKEHAALIASWRNDPQALKMSFTYTEKKTLEEFYPQFLFSYFSHPTLPSLFAIKGGERVGLVRFDPDVEISLLVNKEKRGQGLGAEILIALEPYLNRKGISRIDAKIKKENGASIKTFRKAGYIEIGQEEDVLLFQRQLLQRKSRPVLIIAEAGSNWKCGSFEEDCQRAYALIEAAKASGADVVKFQTFKRKSIYVPNPGQSDYLSKSGVKRDIGELFEELEMPQGFLALLAKHCLSENIELMSSVFSPEDFEEVDPFVKRHKIASYEISHPHLLKLAAQSGKPLILSTGASSIRDIDWAVETFYSAGGKDLTLLQCTARYPAPDHSMNLNVISSLRARYNVEVGLSDHSLEPLTSAVAATALGASTIEKHFTLSRHLKGPDHAFAIEPKELKSLVEAVRACEAMLGIAIKHVGDEEKELYYFARRGIQALRNIPKGEILREGVNFAILRPGKRSLGAHPKFLSQIEGRKASHALAEGEGIQPEDLI